jgi:hypothetical protein
MDTAAVNWDFVVLFGTILFWALLHMFSPDGRQWRSDFVHQPAAPDPSGLPDPSVLDDVQPRHPRR